MPVAPKPKLPIFKRVPEVTPEIHERTLTLESHCKELDDIAADLREAADLLQSITTRLLCYGLTVNKGTITLTHTGEDIPF
jgi:hypothetical protein